MDIKVIEGNLVITLPLNAEGELSGSGKNFTIASTHGFQPVEGQPGYTLSLTHAHIKRHSCSSGCHGRIAHLGSSLASSQIEARLTIGMKFAEMQWGCHFLLLICTCCKKRKAIVVCDCGAWCDCINCITVCEDAWENALETDRYLGTCDCKEWCDVPIA